MKAGNGRLLLAMLLAYAGMLLLNFYAPWFSLPDGVLLLAVTVFFCAPKKTLWLRALLPLSLLMDTAAHVPLGWHALFYGLSLMLLLALFRFWQTVSSAGRLSLLLLACLLLQAMRCLLLFLWTGISAPQGWFWVIPLQALLWPLYHQGLLHFLGWRPLPTP